MQWPKTTMASFSSDFTHRSGADKLTEYVVRLTPSGDVGFKDCAKARSCPGRYTTPPLYVLTKAEPKFIPSQDPQCLLFESACRYHTLPARLCVRLAVLIRKELWQLLGWVLSPSPRGPDIDTGWVQVDKQKCRHKFSWWLMNYERFMVVLAHHGSQCVPVLYSMHEGINGREIAVHQHMMQQLRITCCRGVDDALSQPVNCHQRCPRLDHQIHCCTKARRAGVGRPRPCPRALRRCLMLLPRTRSGLTFGNCLLPSCPSRKTDLNGAKYAANYCIWKYTQVKSDF